jgi:hypothetical protein
MGCSIATDVVTVLVLFYFISFHCIAFLSTHAANSGFLVTNIAWRTAAMCLAFSPELTLFDSQQARSSSRFTQLLQKAASTALELR